MHQPWAAPLGVTLAHQLQTLWMCYNYYLFLQRNTDRSHTDYGLLLVGFQLEIGFLKPFYEKLLDIPVPPSLLLGNFVVHVYSLVCSPETGLISFYNNLRIYYYVWAFIFCICTSLNRPCIGLFKLDVPGF